MDSYSPPEDGAAAEPARAERRPDGRPEPRVPAREERRKIALDAHILRGSGEIVSVELHDLSYDGCKIRTPEYLWQGEKLKLSVPRRGVIEAVVRWCTGGLAGLVFGEDAVPPRPKTPRAETRVATKGDVILRRLGLPAFRVDVHDLSRVGCKIELIERPSVGELVTVKFDGLEPLEARIKWVEGFTAGAMFDRAIHPAVFDILSERLAAAA